MHPTHVLRFLLLPLLISAILTLSGCDLFHKNQGKTSGVKISKILVISDSMGTGYGIAEPYPEKIALELGVEVINNSLNGRQTEEIIDQIPGLLDEIRPSHLIVLMGTNDARKNKVDIAVANLEKIASEAIRRNIVVTLGTVPTYPPSPEIDARAQRISDQLLNIPGVNVADIRSALGDGSQTLGDGIHPNESGQVIVSQYFINKL